MVTGFTASKEGRKEYSKLGLTYPEEIFDELYEKWLIDTSANDLSKYTRHKKKEVTMIKRLKTGAADEEGHEYLVYSFSQYRLDQALNVVDWWRPNIGVYPIPRALYKINQGPFGKQDREVSEIISIETGYSIPFSKKKFDEIRSIGLEIEGKVSYSLQTPNGLKLTVASYEDLRDGDFNELAHFGRIPNPVERQRWLDERGVEKDQQWQEQVLRQKVERDIPKANVTEEQVREIIKVEAATTAEKEVKAAEEEKRDTLKKQKKK